MSVCVRCGGDHGGSTWRCEACRTVFVCNAAHEQQPDGIAMVTMHSAFPIVAWRQDQADPRGKVPVLGPLVLCGPVVEGGGPTMTERAIALAADQRARRQARVPTPLRGDVHG